MEQILKNDHESNLSIEIDRSWKEQIDILNKIKKAGNYQNYFDMLNYDFKKEAFRKPEKMIVGCIDEGCTHNSHQVEGPILNLGGSGILYPVEETVEMLKDKNIEIISSHDGCGAAALAEKDPYTYTSKVVEKINDYRKKNGMQLVKHIHIPAENMTRDENFHEAVAVYYNFGDDIFDATRVVDENGNELLGKGFTIDRGHFNEENSLAELGISIDIAFGHHGYGDRFTKENPLTIVFIESKDNEEQEKAINFLKDRKEFNEGKINIDFLMKA